MLLTKLTKQTNKYFSWTHLVIVLGFREKKKFKMKEYWVSTGLNYDFFFKQLHNFYHIIEVLLLYSLIYFL